MRVPATEITRRITQCRTTCREAGQPITPQRLAVYTHLAGTTAHPTAQAIFEAIRRTYPHISFATVYKNLDALEALGLIRRVTMRGAVRYDADLSAHHHIVNLDTDEVSDLFDTPTITAPKLPRNLTLERVSVKYYVRNA